MFVGWGQWDTLFGNMEGRGRRLFNITPPKHLSIRLVILSQHSRFADWDLNPGVSEYEVLLQTITLRRMYSITDSLSLQKKRDSWTHLYLWNFAVLRFSIWKRRYTQRRTVFRKGRWWRGQTASYTLSKTCLRVQQTLRKQSYEWKILRA
jgi:hypothetical protein